MRWLLLLCLLGCADPLAPFVPVGAAPLTPAANFAELWQQVETCSGLSGDWHRIDWFAVPTEQFATPEGWAMGRWQPSHMIYLSDAGQRTYRTIQHEMLHDLLQSGDHPPVFDTCGVR